MKNPNSGHHSDGQNKKLNGEPLRLHPKRRVQPIRPTPCSICQNKRTVQPIRPTPCSICQNKRTVWPIRPAPAPCSICQNKMTVQPIRPAPCSICQNKKSFPSILHIIQTGQAAFRAGYKFIHISQWKMQNK